MFTKLKVTQSMVDAVNKVLDEAGAPIKEPTSTGMKVYGRSYGNSAKAKQDQTKSSVDDLKGPKTKELMQKDKEDYIKTKGKYDEELKGDQHKIDANKNNKVDAHDFAILRGKKKVKESFSVRLEEKWKSMKEKKDVVMPEALEKSPAKNTDVADKSYLKDKPGSVKSDLKNLGRFLTGKKETNEETEQIGEASCKDEVKKHEKKMHGKAGEVSKHVDKMHKEEVELTEGVEVKKEYDDKKEAEHGVYHNGKKIGYVVHDKKNDIHTAYHNPTSHDDHGHADDYGQIDDFHKQHHAIAQIKASAGLNEEVESLEEKNVPTSPEKWAKAKAAAKSKFDVYPSAYANGWASKKYKAMGGGWKSVSEESEEAYTEEQLDEMINEVLGKDASAGDWISDFVHSDNPKFDGKSKAKRKEMALAAYYAKQRNEGVDNVPFDGPYTKTPSNVKDKSGAIHTPMSRAKNLARSAFKKVQDRTKISKQD